MWGLYKCILWHSQSSNLLNTARLRILKSREDHVAVRGSNQLQEPGTQKSAKTHAGKKPSVAYVRSSSGNIAFSLITVKDIMTSTFWPPK